MTAQRVSARRGQPLIALAMLLLGWVCVRAATWEPIGSEAAPPVAVPAASPTVTGAAPASASAQPDRKGWRPSPARLAPRAAMPSQSETIRPAPVRPMPLLPAPGPAPVPDSRVRIAAGHQLLWLAGVSQLPLPPEVLGALREPPATAARPPAREAPVSRWSGDGWLLLRPGGAGFNLPGAGLPGASGPSGSYGASQMGAVIRYRLAPSSPLKPALYLRASSAVRAPRGEEVAAGLSLRPLRAIPVAAMGEVRATRTLDGVALRPAAMIVSEFPALPLPLGLRGEAYVQAGVVGGRFATAFVDGQARVDRKLIEAGRVELRAGGGAWGGAQKGVHRIDVGPSATLSVPVGPVGSRLSADWRFRVAGNAAPGSGPALTLSAGF